MMTWLKKLFGQQEKPASATPASATLQRDPDGDVYVLRITGVLNKATVDRIQAVGANDFAKGKTNIKLMLVLKEFRGWKRGDDWGNIDFFAEHEHNIAKIAVVGEPQWESQTLLFLAAGHRTGEVRYFGPFDEAKAKAWLNA
jgi:hypothetical protein